MEQAILETLIYADIFDYPLKINEIHKWLIGRYATLRQVEKALRKLNQQLRISSQGEYYFLPGRERLVSKRIRRQIQSGRYLRKAQILIVLLKLVPWVKLVGISGGLAWNNASEKDDIDLFIITGKNRLWLSRLFCVGLLSLIGQRRKRMDAGRKIAGKLCLNILLEENQLQQDSQDIYVAHEVLQMKVLWQRNGIYSKYLEDNSWVFQYLPNWITTDRDLRFMNNDLRIKNHKSILDYFENLAEKFQLWYMRSPQGSERITDGALYFHPTDLRQQILANYQRRLKSGSGSISK